MQSVIQLTCCSIEGIIFDKTEGLPGPVTVNKLGKLVIPIPKYDLAPSSHWSLSFTFPLPEISIFVRAPVIASNPVAMMSVSTS